MALVFHPRLAVPLWALGFFTVALTATAPGTLSLAVILGIAVIAVTMPWLVPSLRASPSVVRLPLTGRRRPRSAAAAVVTGACPRALPVSSCEDLRPDPLR